MGLDLTTYPAPWRAWLAECHKSKWILTDANDEYIGTFEDRAVAEFIALARNAFDVMMRRGWFVVPNYMIRPGTFWRVKTNVPNCDVEWKEWPDPFTALVEADKWYVANVEARDGKGDGP